MKQYEKYKDSGIPWIGEIPAHWEVVKCSHYLNRFASGSTPTSGNGKFFDGEFPWLNTGDLNDGYIYEVSNYITADAVETFIALTLHPDNSLVIAMYGATIGKLGITTFPVYSNQACCAIHPSKKYTVKFLFYIFSTMKKYMISLSYGGGQPNISQSLIKNLRLPYLTIYDQQAIADYLDKKTSEINNLIDSKEKLITDLEAYRTSVINEAVTKGLDKNSVLKDSGIPWIGEIPKHWKVKKIKNLTIRLGSGKTPKGGAEVYEETGVIFLRSQNIRFTGLFVDNVAYINEATHKNMSNTMVKYGDVLLNITGASIGRCCVYNLPETPANVNQHVSVIRVNGNIVYNHHMHYYWCTSFAQNYINFTQTGANREGLSAETIGNFNYPLPPLSEQQAIADYLDKKTQQIDSIISDTKTQIEKLKEYRNSLINEAVTGKTKVS